MNIDTYIYVKKTSSQIVGDNFQINLIPNNDRPFNTIQIISAVIEADTQYATLAIRSNLQPLNGYSVDGYSTALCVFDYNSQLTMGHYSYSLAGYEQPKYEVSNTLTNFRITIMDESGGQLTEPQVLHFSIIFKLSYFNPRSPAIEYRAQIPF